ncbi:class I SAM-dependent methyltransferase [Candidatus Bipolaricaulota bacterium]|nr:class I SAM-dependent methyltransferase [Candidatus Bipolaricaulota bacterium]
MTEQLSRRQYKQTVLTYDRPEVARRFWETQSGARDKGLATLLQEFVSLVRQGQVVDLGCGTGADVAFLRSQGLQTTGVDKSLPLIEHARETYGPYFSPLNIYDCEVLGHRRFHGLLCICTLIHLPRDDWLTILRSFNAILRPHGLLLLSLKEGTGVIRDDRLGRENPRYVQLCTASELELLLLAAGFAELDFRQTEGKTRHWLHVFARAKSKSGCFHDNEV